MDKNMNVQQAANVLTDELRKHGDLYKAFLASIESSLSEHHENSRSHHEVAEKILKRIIGEE